MRNLIFLTVVLALGVKDSCGMPPLMAIAPMVSAGRGLISTITNAIAPGHNEIKDPFAVDKKTLLSLSNIQERILKNQMLAKATENALTEAQVILNRNNQQVFDLDQSAENLLNITQKNHLKISKLMISSHLLVDELPQVVSRLNNEVSAIMTNFGQKLANQKKYSDESKLLAKLLEHIQTAYGNFKSAMNPNDHRSLKMFDSLFGTILSLSSNEITVEIAQIGRMLTAETSNTYVIYKGFLEAFDKHHKSMNFNEKCSIDDTDQNRLKRIYNLVSIAEYRVLLMKVTAHKYFEIRHNQIAWSNIYQIFDEYITRTISHLTAMKNAMAKASTELYQCDPSAYLLDVNTFQLTNLFSLIYLSTDQIGERCSRNCEDINTLNKLSCKKITGTDETVTEWCPKQQCNGRILNCQVKNFYEFCEAREGAGPRYHWIERTPNKSKRQACNGRWVDIMKKSNCMECLCQCAAEGSESTATRAFSLIPQLSDISNNRVVTNIRFRKKDNVVRIQVQEAQLLPAGDINTTTVRWIPLDDLIYWQNVPQGGFAKRQGTEQIGLVLDEDYTFMSKDKKALNLDDIKVDEGYIITGVRFRNSENNPRDGSPNLSPLAIEVFKTKFDYQNGILSDIKEEQHIPVSVYDSSFKAGRTRINTGIDYVSTENPHNHEMSKPHAVLQFRMTSRDDYGKAVVPFFDARAASSSSRFPLSGIGIMHRTNSTMHGGFISPKLIGLDHSRYINTTLTPEERATLVDDFKRKAQEFPMISSTAIAGQENSEEDEEEFINPRE